MKKILLGTTTLIGVAALFAGAASADTPKVTLGGFEDFQVGVVNQDLDTDQRSHSFRSDTEVTLRIDGTMDNGLKYGGGINLEADVDGDGDTSGFDSDNQGFNASQTYIYTEGMWGRVEMGSRVGVTNTMKVDASSIARATGGIDGDFTYYLNPTTGDTAGANHDSFIATPDLIMDYGFAGGVGAVASASQQYGDESTENNNKVTYYTPRFSGFQAGLGYTVDSTASRGQIVSLGNAGTFACGSSTGLCSQAENIFSGGLNWEGKFDQVGIMLAGTGEWGSAEATTYEDLRTWNLGAKVTYMGFALAGSYGDWGDSLRPTADAGDDATWYWTVGGSYETGPFAVSVTYLKSQWDQGTGNGEDEFHNLSVGADYKMAPGFTPYAEVSFIDADPAAGTNADDNGATVFIAGTQLAF